MVERRQITAWISRGMPVFLVALLWAGLWQLWPDYEPVSWRARQKPFKVRLVSEEEALALIKDPTVFAFESDISFKAPGSDAPVKLGMPEMPAGRTEFLGMSGQLLKARARGDASSFSVWDRSKGDFEGEWRNEELFSVRAAKIQLVVELSDNLLSAGYLPSDMSTNDFSSAPAGWEVRLLLDVDQTGVPSHVLIEKSSGNKDIDTVVCRKAMQGRSAKKAARGGRIKVSYGFE